MVMDSIIIPTVNINFSPCYYMTNENAFSVFDTGSIYDDSWSIYDSYALYEINTSYPI